MKNNIKFFINKEKRVIVAVAGYNGKYVQGIAKCCPEDDFDIDLGKSLAEARLNLKIERKKVQNAEEKLSQTAEILSQNMDSFRKADHDVKAIREFYQNAEENLSQATKILSQTMYDFRRTGQDVKATKILYQNAEKRLKAIEDNLL